ncbi:MAG: acyl-CoA dehydrogenase family protein [Gammaproteobacteria bacterium]
MDFAEPEEIVLLRDNIRRFVTREIPPAMVAEWERTDVFPRELIRKLADELGICGLAVAEEFGGSGRQVVALTAAVEELSRFHSSLGTAYLMCASYAGLNITEAGSQEQKRRFLPGIVAGRTLFALGLSEPNVGADLARVETRARRDGERVIVKGAKRWTTGASIADYVYALVRSGDGADRRNSLSFVIVPTDAPGVTITDIDTMGARGVATCDVIFDDVEVPFANVVGGEAGWNNGWAMLAGPGLEVEKLQPSAVSLGAAEAAVAEAWQYSQERVQGGKRICAYQAIRHMLAEAQTRLQACRLMLRNAAWLVETHQPSAVATSMAKLFVTDTARDIALSCQQVMGAYGFARGYAMERLVRETIIGPIAGGSSNIQRNNIANLMKLPRE